MITEAASSTPHLKKVDWNALRSDFAILGQQVHGHPLIYFDNAATTQKPRPVLEALRDYYERDNANVHRGIHELSNRATAAFEAARQRAAQFINARSSDEIIFTRGTTEGINLVAYAWGGKHIKRGDKILLTEMEHHSNIVPWQMLAERVEQMPPFQGGGEMILEVDFQKTTYKKPPHRFEAGTPDISGAIGLHAAMDYLDTIGRENIAQHDQELGAYALEKLLELKGMRRF